MSDWQPLTRWGRIVQWFERYAPFPLKRCMVCRRWFYNQLFWRSITWRYGCPEYCSHACADRELEALNGDPNLSRESLRQRTKLVVQRFGEEYPNTDEESTNEAAD